MRSKMNERFVYQAVLAGDLEIRPDGSIWRVRKRGWDRWKKQAVSRPCKPVQAEHDSGAYFQVRVMVDSVRVYALAHRLVFMHFSDREIPPNLTVNHRDGRKKNNDPLNLEIATHSEQQLHAVRVLQVGHAANQHVANNSMAKLPDAAIETIRARYAAGGVTQQTLADEYGVLHQQISRIVRGDLRTKQPGPTADYTSNRTRGARPRGSDGRFM